MRKVSSYNLQTVQKEQPYYRKPRTQKCKGIKLTQKQLNDLHTRGYIVVKKVFPNNITIFRELDKFADEDTEIIFNTKKTNDKKRSQVTLTGCNVKVKMTNNTKSFVHNINMTLKNMFPDHTPSDMVVLRSDPGCKAQIAHQDYRTKDLWPIDEYIPDKEFPLGVVIALMDDTYFDVWPESIGFLNKKTKINPKRLKINKEDVVIFRGDLVHAGASFEEYNIRIHTYLDHPKIKRKQNSTEFASKLECIVER